MMAWKGDNAGHDIDLWSNEKLTSSRYMDEGMTQLHGN